MAWLPEGAEQEQGGGRGDRHQQRERQDDGLLAGDEIGWQERAEGQEQRGEPEARPEEPAQQPVVRERLHYFINVTSLKIGRYIATTSPPTTTPRKTIINGSSSDVSAVTAVSTSSS